MAHGGVEGWNDAVIEAVQPLAREVPTAIAFGMADKKQLTNALDSLRSLGVQRVSVVRMFMSGDSFLAQTEYLLGLSDSPPAFLAPPHRGAGGSDDGARVVDGLPSPIHHGLTIGTHLDGMVDSEEARQIFAERATDLSTDPANESVLLVAHGMGDEVENDRLLTALSDIEATVAATPFHTVRSATLREDWAPAREEAEKEIRSFVATESEAGRTVIVVPVRLSGFGPYAEVLEGLDYVGGEALLPHEKVSGWIVHTAFAIACAHGWDSRLIAMMLSPSSSPASATSGDPARRACPRARSVWDGAGASGAPDRTDPSGP